VTKWGEKERESAREKEKDREKERKREKERERESVLGLSCTAVHLWGGYGQ